ncbi:MAG: FecR family protein [Pirellulales bacterium]|nr:FecR family protein [Pirellulales bacterium]
MIANDYENSELDVLCSAVCDENVTDQDISKLEELLAGEEAIQAEYYHWIRLHTTLRFSVAEEQIGEEVIEQIASDVEPVPSGSAKRTRSIKLLLDHASRRPGPPAIAVAVAVVAAILLAMALTPAKWIAGKGSASKSQPTANSEFVAILNSWQNDVWAEGTRPPLDDPRLEVGRRLVLESGLIEIKYHTGARVVIEGPAEFIVGRAEDEDRGPNSPGGNLASKSAPFALPPAHNSGYLVLGRLVARVEGKEAKGFTIYTPHARVEDLGTEFAVLVNADQMVEAYVIQGEIDVHQGERSRRLLAGQFITVRSGRVIVDSENVEELKKRFARFVDLHQPEQFLLVDFDQESSRSTQGGFTSHGGAVTTHSLGSATVTIRLTQPPAPLFDRKITRGTVRSSGSRFVPDGTDITNLVTDFVFPATTAPRSIDIVISGPAATYHFEGWFHDAALNSPTQFNQSLSVSTTGLNGTFRQVGDDIQPSNVTRRAVTVDSNGANDVVIRVTNAPGTQTRFNGFALEQQDSTVSDHKAKHDPEAPEEAP